jgi:hypothetical protein
MKLRGQLGDPAWQPDTSTGSSSGGSCTISPGATSERAVSWRAQVQNRVVARRKAAVP